MNLLILVVATVAASIVVVGIGDRLRLPWPALMVLLGLGVAAVPAVGSLRVDPELILPLLLPPLLFATAQRTSWALFRARWRAILYLAVALTVVTITAVAGTAVALVPGLTVTAAVALAAALSPPDPVAVEAVAGSLRMPQRLLASLRSEGLFNDAVSLVVFQTALAALADGSTFGVRVVVGFGYGLVVAVAVGVALAWLAGALRPWLSQVAARSALTLVLPFAVYLAAEQLGASGVIAVVVAALQVGVQEEASAGEDRLTGRAFWNIVELVATGIAFGLVGVELRVAIGAAGDELPRMLAHAAVICTVVIVVRALWMTLAALVTGRRGYSEAPRGVGEYVVLTWCGMRGLVTLALALALPTTIAGGAPFPARTEAVVIACSVIVVTLLVPAFTLRPLVNALGVTAGADTERKAEIPLVHQALRAATAALREPPPDGDEADDPERDAQESVRRAESLDQLHAVLAEDDGTEGFRQRREEALRRRHSAAKAKQVALDAARAAVLESRRQPGTDPEAADRVLRRLDQQTSPGSV